MNDNMRKARAWGAGLSKLKSHIDGYGAAMAQFKPGRPSMGVP